MLKGKISVVTGGTRGIGAAIVRKLASMGSDIAIIYGGNSQLAEEMCRECEDKYGVKAVAYQCNVADYDAAKETADLIKKEFGTVNVLVNNAGVTRDGLVATMKEKDFDDVIDVNLKGAFNMIRHCTRMMIKNRGGQIINITSVSGIIGNAGQANYSASKAGLIGLTKSVARELAPRGVTCNAVAPGYVMTDMTKDLATPEEEIKASIPLGRLGSPEDIAETVAFLTKAEYITGEIIRVDGGIAI